MIVIRNWMSTSIMLQCKFGGGLIWEHNTIVSTLNSCLDKLSIPHQVEPRNRYAELEN